MINYEMIFDSIIKDDVFGNKQMIVFGSSNSYRVTEIVLIQNDFKKQDKELTFGLFKHRYLNLMDYLFCRFKDAGGVEVKVIENETDIVNSFCLSREVFNKYKEELINEGVLLCI